VLLLAENQSAYIPLGQKHCFRNLGKMPPEIIAVQSGNYLGDDIVRFVRTTAMKQDHRAASGDLTLAGADADY
jgi:mannose-1-phosphate guanylyltransferase / mannose-6-phosphate isomerase